MIYVYAILEGLRAGATNIRGIEAKPISFLTAPGLSAACSSHDDSNVPPTAENVLAHERAVEHLMRDAVLLPARFGTILPSEDAARDLLRVHETELREALDRVRGCDELGVRALQLFEREEQEELPAPKTGREYLLGRMAAERLNSDAERRSDAIHDNLSALCRASTRRRAAGFVLSGAYLVPHDRTELFRSRVIELAAENPDLRLLCTGPWPPYNFAPQLKRREASHV
jgi:hypothetical protein